MNVKIVTTFDLPDEMDDLFFHLQGFDYWKVLQEIDRELRHKYKYEFIYDVKVEEVRKMIREECQARGIVWEGA